MTALYIIAFLIACIGIVLALGITPERVGEDMKRFFDKQQTMQDMAKEAQGKKKPNKLMVEMIRIRKVLEETNKENQFSIALALSLVLMVFGCILGIVIDNIFLAPILAVAFALIPFVILLIRNFELSEGDVADCHIKEAVGKACVFKSADRDVLLLIELPCDPARNAVKLNAIYLTTFHTLRQISDEIADAAGRLKDVTLCKAHVTESLIHGLNNHIRGIESGQRGLSCHRVFLRCQYRGKLKVFRSPCIIALVKRFGNATKAGIL